jgi:hypothetical protein
MVDPRNESFKKRPRVPTSVDHDDTDDHDDSKGIFWIFALIFGSLVVLHPLSQRDSAELASKQPGYLYQNESAHQINLKLKTTQAIRDQLEMEAIRANEEVQARALSEGGLSIGENTPHTSGMELAEENREKEIVQNLNSKQRKFPSPDDRINTKIERDKFLRQYEEQYKQAYVAQFLKNARERGLDVRLNENLEVIDVRPLDDKLPLQFPVENGSD